MTNEPEFPPSQGGQGGQGWQGGAPPPYQQGGGYGQQPPPPNWGGPPPGPPGYGGPGGPGGMGMGGDPQPKGFFQALFDLSFNSFATPAVVKVLYIIGMVLLGLGYVIAVIASFTTGVGMGLAVLIGGAIAVLFYLTLFRITLEFYYAVVRMSEDIHHRR